MRILMINKFLYPNGGSETYIFKLGEYLEKQGHEVQYFGMEHEHRCVGNAVNAYTSNMEFHGGSKLSKLSYPIKTIYSLEARKKIRLVLEDFKPNVCHLNNFNYQLTPSIILEIEKWRKEGNICRIIMTAHDYQLICPNHMCNNPNLHENCEKCLGGHFYNCFRGKCIHGSRIKSLIGTVEAYFWKIKGVYKYIDSIICCSEFLKKKMDSNPIFAKKTICMHNFVEKASEPIMKKNYVLYFGRYSEEKGVRTLIKATKLLPEIKFIFAGKGDYTEEIKNLDNVEDVGYKSGEELDRLICEARFSVCPSEWYEPFGLTVLEALSMGTPVLAAKIGGIQEIIKEGENGEFFESGNIIDLEQHIMAMWYDNSLIEQYESNCISIKYNSLKDYSNELLKIYGNVN